MLYENSFYEATNKPKSNKIKIFFLILLSIILILLSIVMGIKTSLYIKTTEFAKNIEKESKEAIENQKRIQEELEAIKRRNEKPFTENQILAIENIYNSDDGEKVAFLTFDDGPTKTVTPLILDLLKQENIKATFFVLGGRVKANPELIRREFEEGHYIANHSYSHVYSKLYANIENVLNEYTITENYVREALGNPNYHTNVFRFPGGSVGGTYHTMKSKAKEYLRQNNIAALDWNALTNDAAGAYTKEKMMESVIETIGEKKHVVILMHDAADKILTYETLPDVIKYLRDKGYTFKNLYDII